MARKTAMPKADMRPMTTPLIEFVGAMAAELSDEIV